MTSADRSHYQAMGLAPTAGSEEIRSTYLRLARTLHPDRFMDASSAERGLAERRMREVTAAWAVLGDPILRQDYDRTLRAEATADRAARSTDPPRATQQATSTSGGRDPDDDDDDDAFVRPRHRDFEGRPIDGDDDEVELSAPAAFLLRRGPVIVMIMIAVGLFVGTALAGPHDPLPGQMIEPTTTTVCPPAAGGCS